MTDILSFHFYRLDFFNDVVEVVSVRLIVSPESKHVGYGFVEFASPCLANMVRLVL